MISKIRENWFSNIREDLLSSFVVGLSMIPETAGFALMVGLSPIIAFYTTFYLAIILSIFGARRGMITAAAGSMSLVLVILVKNYGIEYIGIATIMTGIIQILFGIFKIGRLLKFIPQAVMFGFVNALGILLFKEQIHFFKGQSYIMYILVGIGLFIIYTFPRLTKVVPSHLIAIVVVTAIVIILGIHVPSLETYIRHASGFPRLIMPPKGINLEVILKILPYSISLALVGTIESLLTAKTLDDTVGNSSNKNRETVAQGFGNLITGLLGGMTGCALVGQSIINTKAGARTRLSTFFAGFSLLTLVLVFSKYVEMIPIAAVVAVMIMISLTTFNFDSIKNIKTIPVKDTINMIIVVVIVLFTDNLAIGVVVGTILNAFFIKSKGMVE